MGVVNNVRMAASKALGSMESLSRQAKSYYTHPRMLQARAVSRQLATSPATMIGAGVGAAGGGYAGFSTDQRNGRSGIGGGIKGALIGAAVGGGAGAGVKGYGMVGGKSGMLNYGRQAYGSAMRGGAKAVRKASNIMGGFSNRAAGI